MKKILYVTGNPIKFHLAQKVCASFNIELEQARFDADEIQGEDGELIARDKAQKAFDHFKQPIVVCDDNWVMPGLNGFPGAYMKSMNEWFTSDDWLRLTDALEDRRVILRQFTVYQDASGQSLFTSDVEGILLHEARGKSPYPHATITSFDGGKTSNAEHHERGESASVNQRNSWHDFAEWLTRESV